VRVEHGIDDFVVVVIAAEEMLGLERGQVEAIEEGMVPFGRRSYSGEEEIVAIQDQGPFAVRQGLFQGTAGILVAVGGGAAEEQARWLRGLVEIDQEGLGGAAAAASGLDQRHTGFFRQLDSREGLLGLEQVLRRTGERRPQCHDAVGRGRGATAAGAAATTSAGCATGCGAADGFHPHQRGRLAGAPLQIARTAAPRAGSIGGIGSAAARSAASRRQCQVATLCSIFPVRSHTSISLGNCLAGYR